MAVPHIKDSITIRSLIFYTMRNIPAKNRIEYWERDVLRSKVKIIKKTIYQKVGGNVQFSTKYEVRSFSRPQYYPYTTIKGRNKKNQSKQNSIEHTYPIYIQFSTNEDNEITVDSKIRWRTGSFRKWDSEPPQNMIKSVYLKTRDRIEARIRSLLRGKPEKDIKKRISEEIDKVKKRGKYLSVGDYNAQELEVYGDGYFRGYPLQFALNSLYGPIWNTEFPERGKDRNLNFPFADKHLWGVLKVLLQKKIIKTKRSKQAS